MDSCAVDRGMTGLGCPGSGHLAPDGRRDAELRRRRRLASDDVALPTDDRLDAANDRRRARGVAPTVHPAPVSVGISHRGCSCKP